MRRPPRSDPGLVVPVAEVRQRRTARRRSGAHQLFDDSETEPLFGLLATRLPELKPVCLADETMGQCGLPDSRFAGEQHHARVATTHVRGLLEQARELTPPADEGCIDTFCLTGHVATDPTADAAEVFFLGRLPERPACTRFVDPAVVVTEKLSEHSVSVLTSQWCSPVVRVRGTHANRAAELTDRPEAWMLSFDDHAACGGLLILQRLGNRVDRAAGHPRAAEDVEPFRCRA